MATGTPTKVTLPDGRVTTGYITNGRTTMADGSRPPAGSVVHTAGGDYKVGSDVNKPGTLVSGGSSSSKKSSSSTPTTNIYDSSGKIIGSAEIRNGVSYLPGTNQKITDVYPGAQWVSSNTQLPGGAWGSLVVQQPQQQKTTTWEQPQQQKTTTWEQPYSQQQINDLIQEAIQALQPQQPQIPEELRDLLSRLNQYQPPKTLSLNEARSRAEAALKPLYDQQLQDTLKTVEQSLVQRGFFGQMPSVPITREEAARIENAKASAIANLANQLTGQSEESARAAENLAMQRAATEAGLWLNALQNAQSQQQQSFSNLASVINMLNAIRQQDREYGLQEAELTGTYAGAPTFPAQMAALTQAYLPFLQAYGSPTLSGDLSTVLQYYYGR